MEDLEKIDLFHKKTNVVRYLRGGDFSLSLYLELQNNRSYFVVQCRGPVLDEPKVLVPCRVLFSSKVVLFYDTNDQPLSLAMFNKREQCVLHGHEKCFVFRNFERISVGLMLYLLSENANCLCAAFPSWDSLLSEVEDLLLNVLQDCGGRKFYVQMNELLSLRFDICGMSYNKPLLRLWFLLIVQRKLTNIWQEPMFFC